MNEPNTYHYETAFEFRLEVNTIPTLEAADALAAVVMNEIMDAYAEQGVSGIAVGVTAKTYDDVKDGIVAYKATCSFTDDDYEAHAFDVGCAIADVFERLGHTVSNWTVTAKSTKQNAKRGVKSCGLERG